MARLNPNQGAEVGKLRPVVIVQADPITQAGLATVIVVRSRAASVIWEAMDRFQINSYKRCSLRSPDTWGTEKSVGRMASWAS